MDNSLNGDGYFLTDGGEPSGLLHRSVSGSELQCFYRSQFYSEKERSAETGQ